MSFYETFREYVRIVEEIDVTELGVYKKDEAPDAASAVVRMQVVHHITMVDEGGKLLTFWFDIPEPKDRDGEVGGGYSLNGTPVTDHHWWPNQAGPSTVRSALTLIEATKIPAANKQAAANTSAIKAADPRNPEHVP